MLIDEQTYAPGQMRTTDLKPSQAIRIGAAMRPQCEGIIFKDGGSCVIGALWEGYGKRNSQYIEDYVKIYAFASRVLGNFVNKAWYLNDQKHWTREAIADWLEAKGL